MARTIDSWKFSPGRMSRLEIQQGILWFSNEWQIVSATFRSFAEWEMKTAGFTCLPINFPNPVTVEWKIDHCRAAMGS
jgi:hypothetical protein